MERKIHVDSYNGHEGIKVQTTLYEQDQIQEEAIQIPIWGAGLSVGVGVVW